MSKIIKSLTLFLVVGMSTVFAQQHQNASVSMFPKAEEGQVQFIIDVPHSDLDQNKKIEFFVGKVVETDACNQHRLVGEFVERNLDGWGYNYHEFKTEGAIMGTLKGCPDDTKIQKFVSGPTHLVPYNGRLPIVMYVPEGYEVKYKIYTSTDEVFVGKIIK